MHVLLVAFLFGCVAYAGIRLGTLAVEGVVPFEDGPRSGTPSIPALIAAGALVGGCLSYRGSAWQTLVVAAFLTLALIAAWVSDLSCGIIPDAFTLIPLAGFVVLRLLTHQWGFVLAGVIVFVPFALAAAFSGGRGMGWGDVKLAALGGVVLGAYVAIWAFLAACVVALIVAWSRGLRNEPIAFGPYLAAAIGTALTIGIS